MKRKTYNHQKLTIYLCELKKPYHKNNNLKNPY